MRALIRLRRRWQTGIVAIGAAVLLLASAAFAATKDVWNRHDARAKIGRRVRLEAKSGDELFKWGPTKLNGRPTLMKPVGRKIEIGSVGTVTNIIDGGADGYEVLIEWDADPVSGEAWESYFHKAEYRHLTEIRPEKK